jgi:uncharacterized protein YebE (UPF0316 family)
MLLRLVPPHSMVQATIVVLSALVRVMPVQASAVGHSTPINVPIRIGTIALVFIVINKIFSSEN